MPLTVPQWSTDVPWYHLILQRLSAVAMYGCRNNQRYRLVPNGGKEGVLQRFGPVEISHVVIRGKKVGFCKTFNPVISNECVL